MKPTLTLLNHEEERSGPNQKQRNQGVNRKRILVVISDWEFTASGSTAYESFLKVLESGSCCGGGRGKEVVGCVVRGFVVVL